MTRSKSTSPNSVPLSPIFSPRSDNLAALVTSTTTTNEFATDSNTQSPFINDAIIKLLFSSAEKGELTILKMLLTNDKVIAKKGLTNCIDVTKSVAAQLNLKNDYFFERSTFFEQAEQILLKINTEQLHSKLKNVNIYAEEHRTAIQNSLDSELASQLALIVTQAQVDRLTAKIGLTTTGEIPIIWHGKNYILSKVPPSGKGSQKDIYRGLMLRFQSNSTELHALEGTSPFLIAGAPVILHEQQTPKNGSCGLVALGIPSRYHLYKTLNEAIQDEENRKELAQEILSFLMMLSSDNAIQSHTLLTKTWYNLYTEFGLASQRLDNIARKIRDNHQDNPDFLNQSNEALLNLLIENNPLSEETVALSKAMDKYQKCNNKLYSDCRSLKVCKAYIQQYADSEDFWLGKYSAKLYAKVNHISLYIYDETTNQSTNLHYDRKTSIPQAESNKVVHMVYRDGQHFNRLYPVAVNLQQENNNYIANYIFDLVGPMREILSPSLQVSTPQQCAALMQTLNTTKDQLAGLSGYFASCYGSNTKQIHTLNIYLKKLQRLKKQIEQYYETLSDTQTQSVATAFGMNDTGASDENVKSTIVNQFFLVSQVVDSDKNTLLHVAAKTGHIAFIKLLLNQLQVQHTNNSNKQGDTPLTLASQHFDTKNHEAYKLLVNWSKENVKLEDDDLGDHKTLRELSEAVGQELVNLIHSYLTKETRLTNDQQWSFWRQLQKKLHLDKLPNRAEQVALLYGLIEKFTPEHNYHELLASLNKLLEKPDAGLLGIHRSRLLHRVKTVSERGNKLLSANESQYIQESKIYKALLADNQTKAYEIQQLRAQNGEWAIKHQAAEDRSKQTAAQLEETKAKLQANETKLQANETKLQATESELHETKSELHETKSELHETINGLGSLSEKHNALAKQVQFLLSMQQSQQPSPITTSGQTLFSAQANSAGVELEAEADSTQPTPSSSSHSG